MLLQRRLRHRAVLTHSEHRARVRPVLSSASISNGPLENVKGLDRKQDPPNSQNQEQDTKGPIYSANDRENVQFQIEVPLTKNGIASETVSVASEKSVQRKEWGLANLRAQLQQRFRSLTSLTPEVARMEARALSQSEDITSTIKDQSTDILISVLHFIFVISHYVIFALQWAPVASSLFNRDMMRQFLITVVFLFYIPPTEFCHSWFLDAAEVVNGHLGSIFTSSFVHSGLVPMLLSVSWMYPAALYITSQVRMAGLLIVWAIIAVSTAAMQMLFAERAYFVGAAGMAAGLGTAALCIGRNDERLIQGYKSRWLMLIVLHLAMGVYQEALSIWGVLGGVLGGMLAAILVQPVFFSLQWCLITSVNAAIFGFKMAMMVPRFLFSVVIALVHLVWGIITSVLAAVRGL